MTRQSELGPLLYRALAEPVGLLLRANEPEAVAKSLQAVKYKIADPALMILQIRQIEHPEGNLAITKNALRLRDSRVEAPIEMTRREIDGLELDPEDMGL